MKNKNTFFQDPAIKKLMANKSFRKAVEDEYVMLATAHKLIELRESRGLSQRALAKKVHMPQQEINDIETGKRNLTIKTMNRLAKAMGAGVDINFTAHGNV